MKVSPSIASLTLAFQTALRTEFLNPESGDYAMSLKISSAATNREVAQIDELVERMHESERQGCPHEEAKADFSVEMAEIKATIAEREGLTKELAAYVDLSKVTQKTEAELEAAGAPHFAKVVRQARHRSLL